MIEYENLYLSNKPFIKQYQETFINVLKSGKFILDNNVRYFENNFAKYINTKFAIGLASGLDALTLSLKAFDFKKNSEVIVPANTFIATILSILHAGLKPVLVEPNIKTYNIDTTKIEEKITKATVAIIVVHLYGKCCQMDEIIGICKKQNLKLIEDSSQSHGAKFANKNAGSFGDIGSFSFYPTKNLGALGDGGAITTNEQKLADKVKILRNYGSNRKYHNELLGYNSRLDELQAAFLNIKLKSLNKINEHKRKLASLYFNNLNEDFIKPVIQNDFYDVYHIFNIRHPLRDKLREYLLKNNIKTEIHYPIPPYNQVALKKYFPNEDFPVSEEIHKTTLSLPISYFHKAGDIEKVSEVINKF